VFPGYRTLVAATEAVRQIGTPAVPGKRWR